MSRPTSQQQLPNLEKLFKDDDDQDFAPLAGSNLAAIFGTPQKLGDVQTPLKQQPLQNKKPTSGRSTPQTVVQPASKTEVIVAKVVHAYKLVNGQYSLVGKLGVALTGNASARVYQLILYRGKQEHVSTVTLSPEFAYTIGENNYATYYDASNENWSLRFENEASCVELAREIGISRFHSAQHQQQPATRPEVFHQDLSILAGGRRLSTDRNDAEAGENDEIRLKCWISANLTQPLKFDATPGQDMRVRISRYDNWERYLLNCAKGLRRLMILPPSKQISLGPGFPKERDVAMEIEIIEVIKNNEHTPSSSPVANKPLPPGGKASILSRMAKMGQSMLPKVPLSATTDSEDTEEELRVRSPRRFKPEVSTAHASKHQSRGCPEVHQETAPVNVSVVRSGSAVPASSSLPLLAHRPMQNSSSFSSPCWPLTPIAPQQHTQYVAMDGQYYPIHPQPAQSLPVAMDPNMSVFLSETRTQNTEIRMGMAKIADNVQKLLDKFHVLEVQNASSPMILQRPFHQCHTEDSRIHRDAESFHSGEGENVVAVNTKNYHSSAENEPCAEFHRAKDPSERERRLEIELNRAKESLDRRDAECARLEAEKREWSNDRSELEERLKRLEEALVREKTALGASNETLAQLREKNSLLESSITTINAEKLSSGNETSASINQKTADIKRLMNNTYRSLLAQFPGDESYEADHIKNTLADTIRKITFSVLNDLERDETEDENSESVSQSVSNAGGTDVSAGSQELDASAGIVGQTENDS